MAAGIVAVIATAISFGIGISVLGWEPQRVLWAILASNFAAWVCLPLTLAGERVAWIKKYLLPGVLRTWAVFSTCYFAISFALIPEIRDVRAFEWMVLPLIFSTGFMIWAYGPVHDFFVRRAQLRARERAKSGSLAGRFNDTKE